LHRLPAGERENEGHHTRSGLELAIEFPFEGTHDLGKEVEKDTIRITHILRKRIAEPPLHGLAGEEHIALAQRPDERKFFAPDGTDGRMLFLGGKQHARITGTQIHDRFIFPQSREPDHLTYHPLGRGEKRRIHEESPCERHEEQDEDGEEAEGKKRGEVGQKKMGIGNRVSVYQASGFTRSHGGLLLIV